MKLSPNGRSYQVALSCAASALALQAACVGQAHAQGVPTNTAGSGYALEEVVVTAERRATDVQKLAASVNVQVGEDLVNQGRTSLTRILENVPGVSNAGSQVMAGGTDTPASSITIRGVASNAVGLGQSLSAVPSTAVYVDDVYNGLGGSFDLDRVEVLRGPQGTLYGRTATAGVVAIHTRDPNVSDYSGNASLELGDYGQRRLEAAVNVPLVQEKAALRIAANANQRNGYDHDKGGGYRTLDLKAKLLVKPSENLRLLLGVAMQDNTTYNGGAIARLTGPDTVIFPDAPLYKGHNKFRQAWAHVDWSLDFATLTYIGAFRTWTQQATTGSGGPGAFLIHQNFSTPDDDFVTHELRLTSVDDGPLTWQGGLFYYNNKITTVNSIRWNSSDAPLTYADATRQTTDIGVFGEATLRLTDALRLTAGLRYDNTTVQTDETYTSNLNLFSNIGTPRAGTPVVAITAVVSGDAGKRTFDNTTYRLRLEYNVNPTSLLYGSVSTGFLPGDVQVSTGASNAPVVNVYDSETVTAYEVGSKNRFLDNRLQLNGGVFYYDYGGYQATVLLDPNNPGTGVLMAIPLKVKGGELEAVFQATSADRVGVLAGVTDAKFSNTPAAFRTSTSNTTLWGFPPVTVTLNYEHKFDLANGAGLLLRAEALLRSAYKVGALDPSSVASGLSPYNEQGRTTIGNLNATWTSADDRYSVAGYIRNIGDVRYKTSVQVQSRAPSFVRVSDPRTLGLVFTAKW